ncbi:MAG: hypothetical protein V4686_03920 [Patescibacteria group bacterium]
MKNIYFAVVLCFITLISINVSAEVYFPESISIGGAVSYDAGTEVKITSVDGAESLTSMTDIEYGVVQTTTKGYSTTYRIVSTQTKSLQGLNSLQDITLVIPNMYENSAKNTYAVFVKYFEKNNPDNKKFVFTDQFSIKANTTPFTRIKDINLLHSNGNIFPLLYGPTIYSAEYAKEHEEENLATTTSLNVYFESNQSVVANPIITFSRLRSDLSTEIVESKPLEIKKGETRVIIPLPTFSYVPGVYMGKISFREGFIKSDLNFQYIVGGGSVTIGMVDVVEVDNSLRFNIFDTPTDLDRVYDAAGEVLSTSSLYTVSGTFLDSKGKVSGNFTKEVDFADENFTIDVKKSIFFDTEINTIELKVMSKDGVVVFESTKNVKYVQKAKINLIDLVVYILLFIFLAVVLVKKSIKLIIIFIVVSILVSLGMYYKIHSYSNYPTPVSDARAPGGHGIGKQVVLTTQDNLYTKKFACGQPVKVNYEFKLQSCANLPSTGAYNIGFAGEAVTSVSSGKDVYSAMDLGIATLDYPASLKAPTIVANTGLIVHTWISGSNPRKYIDVLASAIGYNIPLQNTCGETPPTCSCSGRDEICTLAGVQVSKTTNAPACALKASCSISLTGTSATFNTIGTGVLGTLTYKDTDTGSAISNPHTKTGLRGDTVVQRTTITDSFDGMTAGSVCSVLVPLIPPSTPPTAVCTPGVDCPGGGGGPVCPGPNCGSGTPPVCPGPNCGSGTPPVCPGPNCTTTPTIKIFKAVKNPVRKGDLCEYTWLAENADRCAIVINGNTLNIQSISGTASVSAADGLNQKGVLTCVAQSLLPDAKATVSTTTLCNVIPEVIER